MRTGARLGVDVGRARIGVARSDGAGSMALPVETVPRSRGGRDDDLVALVGHAGEHEVVEVVVGLPLSLSGGDTPSTQDARDFAAALAARLTVPVRLVDERLSTVSAQGALRASGRPAKRQRSVVDQVAAVIILQHALDQERSSGRPPGNLVARDDA